MNKEELIKELRIGKIHCMLIDDSTLDPNEIIIIIKHPVTLHKLFPNINSRKIISESGKIRIVSIYSYNDLCCTSYTSKVISNLCMQDETVHIPNKIDSFCLLLVISFLNQNNNWLFYHLTNDILPDLDTNNISGLHTILEETSNIKSVNNNYKEFTLRYINQKKSHNKFKKILFYILPSKILGYHSRFHSIHSKKKYVNFLISTGTISRNATALKSGGASGGVFIKDEDTFLKGNELFEYCGIPNEIYIRDMLEKSHYSTKNFIPILDYSKKYAWIKYPYINFPNLSDYKKNHIMNNNEIQHLGKFLIALVDELYSLNINHNDLRPSNILIKSSDTTIEYILSDFGCASIKGSYPWKKHIVWGHYFSKRVCGKYRYNDYIIDDCASAYMTYIECGGKSTDCFAIQLLNRIGRQYLCCTGKKWYYIHEQNERV